MTDVFVPFLLLWQNVWHSWPRRHGTGAWSYWTHCVQSGIRERCMLRLSFFLLSLGPQLIELCMHRQYLSAGYNEIPSKMPKGISPRVFKPLTSRHELSQTQVWIVLATRKEATRKMEGMEESFVVTHMTLKNTVLSILMPLSENCTSFFFNVSQVNVNWFSCFILYLKHQGNTESAPRVPENNRVKGSGQFICAFLNLVHVNTAIWGMTNLKLTWCVYECECLGMTLYCVNMEELLPVSIYITPFPPFLWKSC